MIEPPDEAALDAGIGDAVSGLAGVGNAAGKNSRPLRISPLVVELIVEA